MARSKDDLLNQMDSDTAKDIGSFAGKLMRKLGRSLLVPVEYYTGAPDEDDEYVDQDPDAVRYRELEAERARQLEMLRDELAVETEEREQRAVILQQHINTRLQEFSTLREQAVAHLEAAAKMQEKPEESVVSALAPEADDEDDQAVIPAVSEEDLPERPQDERDFSRYRLPKPKLLNEPEERQVVFVTEDEVNDQKRHVQETLDNFGIDAVVRDAVIGPRITQIRLRPGPGVRVESITALSKNLAMALSATSIRLQAPIPGEPFVGIEIPNGNDIPLTLRSMMETKAWKKADTSIPIILGMDLRGEIVITDLAKAPHLLIAGATGSGKSVCMNSLILCMLARFQPDELQLVLVDPKHVEFNVYAELPHLITPVVTDPKQVVPVLSWVIREMEGRYQELAQSRARNIASYNAMMEETGGEKMPFIVVIIDELADIMMTARGDIETSLARIAQLSRAVGIHTIIATQRPSVNVITGTIKANYPTRISFRVASQFDSRTILDGKGAESLRGQGDMLFNPPGIGRLQRIQGPLVLDDETERFVEYITKQAAQQFNQDIAMPVEDSEDHAVETESDDPLMQQAIEIVIRDHRASASYLQRCLRIGYNRAANLVEQMEERGIVGPQVGSTPREILHRSDM